VESVSIIMPAYNAEKYIEESILSAVNQTYRNWELIIINDGSTDNTRAIAEKFSNQDKRIKVVNQQNKRLGGARNTGIQNSTGEWIAFLDSDDLWEPAKLEKQIQATKAFPNVDVIYTAGWTLNEDDLNTLTPYDSPAGNFTGSEMYNVLLAGNVIPVLSVLVKKNIINKIGDQEENPFFHGCEDWDYWFRMAIQGANFYGMDEKLFYYRRHGSNMSGNSLQIAQAAVLLKNFGGSLENRHEIRSELKKTVNPLITRLIAEDRIAEAAYLLKGARNIGLSWDYAVNALLINLAGKYSAIPVRLLMRLNKLFSK
jgi:teichuronic acid biosynthesis glycosyltransferase TuaG